MNYKPHKLIIIVIILFILINNYVFSPGNILSWDVFGYYLYLPFKFIYHDLGLIHDSVVHDIIEKYNNTATFYQVMKMPAGNYVMKYSMGLSFFYAPFFFIGHLYAWLFNYPMDGFSVPYQYSIFIGSILYTLLGIWALYNVLTRFFTRNIAAIVLAFIVFSTNYVVHITMYGQNAISHNYLFTTYAVILWLTILWHDTHKWKYAILLGIVCGITILSRPSEVVCLIIPALWNIKNYRSIGEKIKLLYTYKKQFVVFTTILFVFGLCQFIYWKIYTGKFLYYSYGGNAGEGFEFFTPYTLEVLLSFRKGWLIYTPIMIFAIIGFYFIYRNNRPVFYALFIYFIANIYLVSSWSCWWYAQSFGQRALIPSYPVMAIGFGYFLTWLQTKSIIAKGILYTLMGACFLLNIFQTRQSYYGIIDGDRMTKKYYFKVFGKMSVTEEDKKLLLIKRSFKGLESFDNEEEYSFKSFKKLTFENSDSKNSTIKYSGNYSFKLDSLTQFSPAIEAPYSAITNKDHAWIKVTAYVYPTEDFIHNPFSLVVHFTHNNYPYKYATYDSEKMSLELNKWNKVVFTYLTPEVRKKSDYLKVLFWNRGKSYFFIDDIQVDVYEKK